MSLYSWISSFSQLMPLGKESCAGAAEAASKGRSSRIARKNQQLGHGKKASSSNKCQHHHQILLPMKPQVQTKIQNIHLKVTFHMFSPIALQPARQDHVTAAPCVGSAVFTICSWGLQLSQGTVASSLLLTHFMIQRFVSLPACGFFPTLECGSKPLFIYRNEKKSKTIGFGGTAWTAISLCFCHLSTSEGEHKSGSLPHILRMVVTPVPWSSSQGTKLGVPLQTRPCSETQPLITGSVQ